MVHPGGAGSGTCCPVNGLMGWPSAFVNEARSGACPDGCISLTFVPSGSPYSVPGELVGVLGRPASSNPDAIRLWLTGTGGSLPLGPAMKSADLPASSAATQNPDADPAVAPVKPGREQEDCDVVAGASSWAAGVNAQTRFWTPTLVGPDVVVTAAQPVRTSAVSAARRTARRRAWTESIAWECLTGRRRRRRG
jgi:hypothetical protein